VPRAMPEALRTFRYRALNRAGDPVNGEMTARDRDAAVSRLQAQGFVPLLAEAAEENPLIALLRRDLFAGGTLSATDLADFIQQLATLIDAGIPAEQSLATLAGPEAAAKSRRIAEDLLRRLRAGSSLGDAMAADSKVFPPIALSMVRAGESSGALEAALLRLTDYLRRSAEIRSSIQSALIYQGLLVATAFGSIILILTVVLPRLKPLFANAHGKLPWETQIVLAASDGLRMWWWALALGGITLAYLVHRAFRDPAIQASRDRLLLRAPLLGPAIRRAETARFARTLGALVSAEVSLPVALTLSQTVLANTEMAEAVARVCSELKEGGGLADPLAASGVFPDLTIQFIRIGEATGRLGEMLLKQADLFDTEVRRLIDRGLSLLVPVVTILLGLVIAAIIGSVMVAILSVNDALV